MISEKVKIDFIFYNRVLLFCSFILGIAYMWGYWSTFEINIFPFLSLFDFLKFSAYPLLLTYIPLLVFQVAIIELHFGDYIQKKLWLFKSRHPNLSFKKSINPLLNVLICFIVLLGLLKDSKTLMLGLPITYYLTTGLLGNIDKNIKNELDVKNSRMYAWFYILMLILPFISFDYGRFRGDSIHANKEYSYTIIERDGEKKIYKFLGYINEHYFFIDRSNQSLIVQNRLDSLALRNFLKKGEQDNPEIGFT